MKNVYKIEQGRFRVFSVVFENVRKFALGLEIEFCSQEWEIIISIGYIFGKLYISFPHKFFYKKFKKMFWGDNFGECGREIGLMVDSFWLVYNLWWWSDSNRPTNKLRSRFVIFK